MSDLPSLITEGIRVSVRTTYSKGNSSPDHQHFVFTYQVEITNESSVGVQLISREWHITDGYGDKRVVKGDGVIGKQPLIAPGETYRYVSGCHFQTMVGHMSGHYNMLRQIDQTFLKVKIPPFTMLVPHLNN